MGAIGINTGTRTKEVTVGVVEVEEHLVILFRCIANTGASELGGNVIDRTEASAVIDNVKALQQATACRVEVTLFESFTTLFRKDFRFLENFGLRGEYGKRGVTDTHVTQVEIDMLVEDCTVVAEPVTDNRVVVLVVSVLPILVQTQLHVNHGLGTRTGGQAQVHVRERLVFLSRGFFCILIGSAERSERSGLCRTVNLKPQHSGVERIQLFQEGFLLRHNLSLVVSGKRGHSRKSNSGGQ